MTAAYFKTFAAYNRWANTRIYAAVAELPAAEFARPRPVFFGSIMATLNHILVGDLLWLARIEKTESPAYSLDQILYEGFDRLRVARLEMDERIVAFAVALTDRKIAADLTYKNTSGGEFTMPLNHVLGHVFNHQTHHRGQVHDMLSQLGAPPPALDLIYFLREAG